MLVAFVAGINPIKVPKITNIIKAINTTAIDTEALTNTASSPCPKNLSIAIKIHPPEIIPKSPAINVKKSRW